MPGWVGGGGSGGEAVSGKMYRSVSSCKKSFDVSGIKVNMHRMEYAHSIVMRHAAHIDERGHPPKMRKIKKNA
jgi:hypothetical protein